MMDRFLIQLAVTLQQGGDVNIPDISAEEVLQNGLNIAYFAAGIIAVLTIIIAGIMYATSAGNAGTVSKAKSLILFSVIGLIVVFAAYAITAFVTGRFS